MAAELRALAGRNQVLTSMIGLGYYDTITPPVIRRNVLENPAWYTAYTPYQPEISQGRLEALLNFQTMVEDLTGLPVAGASMLDESTAAAEAMALAHRAVKKGDTFLVDVDAFPQTLDVVRTRAVPLGLRVVEHDFAQPLPDGEVFGVLVQYPGASGAVRDLAPVVEAAHDRGAQVVVAADLLALTLLKTPGEFGADIAVGTTQRFGVPLGLRRPARRLSRNPVRPRAAAARAAGRRLGRCRRRPRLPARPADPRAAHPPREGDVEHLHRAGAACGHRLDVRRLPRPERARRDRAPGAPVRRRARGGPAGRRCRRRRRRDLRHRDRVGARARGRDRERCPCRRDQPAARRRRHGVDRLRRGDHPRARRGGVDGVGVDRLLRRARRRRRAVADPRDRVPHPPGLPRAPQRDRDAALPAPAGRPRLRARPRHDPARVVHDEAQRDDRDGADQQSRLRPGAPVRAGRPVRRLHPAVRRPAGLAGRDHRLRRDLAAAQRRLAGRVRGAARDPQLPPRQRRRPPRRVPDPGVGARHQRRVGGAWRGCASWS